MPQNTPMKRQFTTIDGRTVMSNLPQHWGGNDWTITGVDNPLPVGNYVQTEAGVWIPQKGSDDGAADVRLTGSNVEEVLFNLQVQNGFLKPIYDSGKEYELFVFGYATNENDIIREKLEDSLHLFAGSEEGYSEVTFVTNSLVDLSKINKLYIEWENKSSFSSGVVHSYFIASKDEQGNSGSFDAKLQVMGAFDRTTQALDVSNLTGEYYIRVHARDHSISALRESDLYVYKIWGEV